MRNLLVLVLAAAVFWLAIDRLRHEQQQVIQAPADGERHLEPIVPLPDSVPSLVADISVHTVDELDRLFTRVEQVLDRPRRDGEQPLISLVLHGPEVEFFALKNYDRYKVVVDRAAKLAALGGVSISICQTRMRALGIKPDEVPAFLNQVPFGPDEVQRLIGEGYVTM